MLVLRTAQVLKTWMAEKGSEDVETGQHFPDELDKLNPLGSAIIFRTYLNT